MPRGSVILPRSLLPLAVLLAVAGGWLLLDGRGRSTDDGAEASRGPEGAGIRLFPFASADIALIEVDRADGVLAFTRGDGGDWRFTRGCDDRADDAAATELAGIIVETSALSLLTETVTGEEASRFGLSGDDAVTLRVTARDGRTVACTVGLRNPVLAACYALVDGRPGTWTVPYTLRVRLLSLPDIVRLRRLWPGFVPATVETLALRPAGAAAADLFARDDAGVWWLRVPADGSARAGAVFAAYARLYADRVTRRDGVDWWRAQDRAIDNLTFQLGQIDVKLFGAREAPAETLQAAGLLPAPLSVRVVLRGGDTLLAAFGDLDGDGNLFALRDGRSHLLRVGAAVAGVAAAPLTGFLRTDALPFALSGADSFTLENAGHATVRAWRRDKVWSTSLVPLPGAGSSAVDLVKDLLITLDRLPIVRPLPPVTSGRDPLARESRFALTVWRAGRAVPDFEAHFGWMEAGGDAASGAVALWMPATGQLLVVPEEIVSSLRALFLTAGGDANGVRN
jgi:hypothetical protein